MLEYFHISDDIQTAIKYAEPIVVIESTVWLHGLPEDVAFATMEDCCRIIMAEKVHPAVTVLARGKIVVGASVANLRELLKADLCRKVNVRDIPAILQKKQFGATTVSATAFIANVLHIPVVLTGGIGGVHRFAEKTFDISADLTALANYPVVTISSGVKTILNVGATLEKLETLGVPVVTYGSDFFPSFYCRTSEFPTPDRVDSVEEIMEIYRAMRRLKMQQGLLVANPIPEENSLPESLINEITDQSILEAENLCISGKSVTPFLLERLHAQSQGETIHANISLLLSNAKLAAKLSRYLFYE